MFRKRSSKALRTLALFWLVFRMVWASLLQCGCQSCCAVRVFRKRSSKALRTSAFFLAWARIESCCCSCVSEALFQGHIYVLREGRFSGFGITSDIDDSSYRAQALFFSMDSKGNVPPFFHLWIPKVTLDPRATFFRVCFLCMAWARILLQFECFGSALPRPYYEDRLLIFGITKLESYK